jgi:hypothetical protein
MHLEAKMKYWETWFLTVGAGLLVGAVISPQSWLAVPLGITATMLGFLLHSRLKGGSQ